MLYRDRHHILVVCDGVVHSPILPGDIKANSLLHLQIGFCQKRKRIDLVAKPLRMYVAFPSQAIEAAAKVVSPLGNLIIDRNLREVCLFVGMMSTAMEHQPGWVEHVSHKLVGVPHERKNELIQLTARVFVAARKRELAKSKAEEQVTLEEVLRPLSPVQTGNDEPR